MKFTAIRNTSIELIRFSAIGLLNTGTGLLLIYAAMFFLNLDPFIANVIGYGIGMLLSFYLNSRWTFKHSKKSFSSIHLYVAACIASYACCFLVVYAGIKVFHVNAYEVQLYGMAAYSLTLFILSKTIIFRSA